VFVTHFLDQVYAVADRITVLRNGQLVGEYEAAKLPRLELISRMMAGKFPNWISNVVGAAITAETKPFLQLRQLSRRNSVEAMDLEISPGEVVGLAGLLGSGRTETARLIFGLDHAERANCGSTASRFRCAHRVRQSR